MNYSSADLKRNGVYAIHCSVNDFIYIGSGASKEGIIKRWRRHRNSLRAGNHRNPILQRDFKRYGESAFKFYVLDFCRPDQCLEFEQEWINLRGVGEENKSYNISPTAGNTKGLKLTDEHRANLSRALKGRVFSEEHRRRIGDAQRGVPKCITQKVLDGRKRRLGLVTKGFTGRRHTEESKQKISRSGGKMRGYKHSPETIAKYSAAQKLRLQIVPEAKEQLRLKGLIGNKVSAQLTAKWYVAVSPEGREILVQSLRAFCAQHSLQDSKMNCVVKGTRKRHKGWICRYAEEDEISAWEGERWSPFQELMEVR